MYERQSKRVYDSSNEMICIDTMYMQKSKLVRSTRCVVH